MRISWCRVSGAVFSISLKRLIVLIFPISVASDRAYSVALFIIHNKQNSRTYIGSGISCQQVAKKMPAQNSDEDLNRQGSLIL